MNVSADYSRPIVEVCVGSVVDAIAAESAGADRLELCSALELGGLTPSMGLVKQVLQKVELPVIAMLRPRSGGFCYNAEEYQTVVADAELLLEKGVAGVAFGFLRKDGRVDEVKCCELVQIAAGRDAVFHRAFDVTPDPDQAIEQLVEAGVTRVLTSGQQADALSGAPLIRKLIEMHQGKIEVMAGGSIRSQNVLRVVQQTNCSQIHTGASVFVSDGSLGNNPAETPENIGLFQQHRVVEQASVAGVLLSLSCDQSRNLKSNF